jgi:hypothetical protein
MPKLPPFALANVEPEPRSRRSYLVLFYFLFAAPLLFIHAPLLNLPYFWDEHGQFVPTALDLLRHGWWVAKSTVPNVHPPGVEVYLVLWYKLFGYSIPVTRVAMLLLAGGGLLATFLLAIELSKGTHGAPAFWAPLLLLASPLFYTQSFMAQLDMPAMVFTVATLWLFLKGKFREAAAASVVLVLLKETGLVTPFVLFLVLCFRKDFRNAAYFCAPAIAISVWLVVLHHKTGYWLGDPGFAHYNVTYSLHPVRILLTFLRRLYYLFVAEFRWVGTLVLLFGLRRLKVFRSVEWRITTAVFAANVVLVSVLGGAELERYLVPVLPLLYVAVGVALTALPRPIAVGAAASLLAGLSVSLFWNPPYPFAFENNYAMVDFVRLQQIGARFIERDLPASTIATAWPYTAGLSSPDFGYVSHRLKAVETNDFHLSSIQALPASSFDVLVVYTRTWTPESGVIAYPLIRRFLARFYEWQPAISSQQCEALGLHEELSWTLHGQTISIYSRRKPSVLTSFQ